MLPSASAGEESLVGGEDHVVEGEQACQHVVVHDPGRRCPDRSNPPLPS